MTASYVTTFFIKDGELSQITDGTKTLNDIAGQKAFLIVTKNDVPYVIDLSLYLLHESNYDLSTTLLTLASTLTDYKIAGYQSNVIPALDPITGKLKSRINVYDANTAEDVTIAWTSIGSPSIRNNIYQRAADKDLVISSSKRDFSNALVSVNGVFHKTYLYYGELYVQGGFFNIKNTRKDQISIYDTTDVGGHTTLPIHMRNIDASNNTPFSGVTLTFPDADFSNNTLLLVIGGYLHALDGTYRVIAKNRVVIDTCKIDLINEFLHNPNTIYTRDGLAAVVFEDRLISQPCSPITVRDEIMFYLWNKYPTARQTTTEPFNLIAFDQPPLEQPLTVQEEIEYYLKNIYPFRRTMCPQPAFMMDFSLGNIETRKYTPTVTDRIYSFLEGYPYSRQETNRAVLTEYEWTMKYEQLVSVIGSVSSDKFKNPAFIYDLLLSKHTFFILVNNTNLYRKKYELVKTGPTQYVNNNHDTPRGTLLYNNQHAIPYIVYSDSEYHQHNFSIGEEKYATDAYKTSIDPPAVPSPLYDIKKSGIDYSVSLLELYSS